MNIIYAIWLILPKKNPAQLSHVIPIQLFICYSV